MIIEFERSGGYANIPLRFRADSNQLPSELASRLMKLVETSEILSIKQNDVKPTTLGPPDVFFYTLSVRDDDIVQSLSFNDVTAPDSIRPLLECLQELAIQELAKGKQ